MLLGSTPCNSVDKLRITRKNERRVSEMGSKGKVRVRLLNFNYLNKRLLSSNILSILKHESAYERIITRREERKRVTPSGNFTSISSEKCRTSFHEIWSAWDDGHIIQALWSAPSIDSQAAL